MRRRVLTVRFLGHALGLVLVLVRPGIAVAEPLVVLLARTATAAQAEGLRQRLEPLGVRDLVVRPVAASPAGPAFHAVTTAPIEGPVPAMARALELVRRRLPGTSGQAEIRKPDLSAPAALAEAPPLADLVARLLPKDRRGYPVLGRVVADRGHAYAAPSADLPPIAEAVHELARGEPLVVFHDQLVCAPPVAVDGRAADGGAAAATSVALALEDLPAALERASRDGLDCLRWLQVTRHPFVPAARIGQPHRLVWVPASFALALTGAVTRGKTQAYLSLKGMAAGQVAYDAVYEDLERQRWRRVAFENPVKERGVGLAVQPAGVVLTGPQGQALKPLPSVDFKPRAVRRRR